MIPKILHFVWVGNKCWTHPGEIMDENKRPDHLIQTWKEKHPQWEIRLWGNDDLMSRVWRLKRQMYDMYYNWECYAGVADLMRYEILHEHGGVYIDADTLCHQPIDDLLDCRAFVVRHRGKEDISNGFIGAVPDHPLFGWMINHLLQRGDNCLVRKGKNGSVGVAIGPGLLTHAIKKTNPDINILPFYTFMPKEPNFPPFIPKKGQEIYGEHLWYGYYNSD